MGIYAIKPAFQRTLKPIERVLVTKKVHPTLINLTALALSIIGGCFLAYSGQNLWLLIYLPFMAFLRTALNALDGMVARDLAVPNQGFGEVLNETLDRISDATIFFGLALASYTNLVLGSVTVIAILINSYLSIVSKAAGGSRQYGGIMGKADRMIVLGVGAVLILVTGARFIGDIILAVILVGTLITFTQRFITTRNELT
jgi:CDP-diacylglycerol---glycerol-3-phosphate 3-phosphatidyltransferase